MIPGSNKEHPSFVRSFGYAIQGFFTAVWTERNIKVQLLAGLATYVAGTVVGLNWLEWSIVTICIGMVISAELVNTSLEAVVDLASPELHPLAKRAKDIAAASVFVLSVAAAIVGVIVFAHALNLLYMLGIRTV
ncbi:diacylglycerol kinase family protein [Collinsella provencensis]|uniref:diacylglycerol kinase family protein n=1 Tax=Collinsella provencensis TaxID=1937461 RepID=UPI000C8445C8|nr:diacylglycerol kinase family protein [Collinsella provencensis]